MARAALGARACHKPDEGDAQPGPLHRGSIGTFLYRNGGCPNSVGPRVIQVSGHRASSKENEKERIDAIFTDAVWE
jgi:hypothetical protein